MGVALNFKIYGSGEPIIILHGFLGSLDNWITFAKLLSENYMIILVDQRNHGKSPHTKDFSFALMVEDLKQLMDAEWIHSAHIIGHSMGGKTAMNFALSYPDLVNRLTVLDIAPRKYSPRHYKILEALNNIDIENIRSRKEADNILQKSIHEIDTRMFLLKNLKRSGNQYSWKFNLSVLISQYPAILESIKSDQKFEQLTLFIRGSDSNYILDNDITNIQAKFPLAKLVTIENAGHWIHSDQPNLLRWEVIDFLNQY